MEAVPVFTAPAMWAACPVSACAVLKCIHAASRMVTQESLAVDAEVGRLQGHAQALGRNLHTNQGAPTWGKEGREVLMHFCALVCVSAAVTPF